MFKGVKDHLSKNKTIENFNITPSSDTSLQIYTDNFEFKVITGTETKTYKYSKQNINGRSFCVLKHILEL